ncbi:[FeFe] hydrogenase H-cluster maturation GTPase HydF [Dehalobacterium formicoaceticum]|uniref:[FeFe] hydrogenase H-cluster maturation GTPase HydF n=1 Tax=Dehalobacterium formicoaceticum TaxID=51515 RepID=A0ABT1Y472_9FIRM|nr:[FeFe] hydrogenase H-cluster maturation GTPase HydF [Dehalobacterium formicoaceticum]MCR6545677.1 [FeFe] hydrogenase H-cluster maturation GTPase HydF [Dehalobacterium formicoaceticum]
MEQTPIASRYHVAIFGATNAGKSALFNSILGQEAVIVSEHQGTTTDPVLKAMELIPFGPIALIDTAGLNDLSAVGTLRIKKTLGIIDRTDLAIYAADITDFPRDDYENFTALCEGKSLPHLLVLTKSDQASSALIKARQEEFNHALFTSRDDQDSISHLKESIAQELGKIQQNERDQSGEKSETLLGDLLPPNSTVVLVIPVDSAAPKGRLILPQVQLIRDCLDHGMKCFVTRERELGEALANLKDVDLVVTDSQVFKIVNDIVPEDIPLTSFSMLLARQKGDLEILMQGVEKIESLPRQAKVLIAEACSHNQTHEDIGRVKIPALMQKLTGKDLNFTFYAGHDFPENLGDYDLVVHCGSCMINKKAFHTRIAKCMDLGVPITNYGIFLAYANGILPRCSEIFVKNVSSLSN